MKKMDGFPEGIIRSLLAHLRFLLYNVPIPIFVPKEDFFHAIHFAHS